MSRYPSAMEGLVLPFKITQTDIQITWKEIPKCQKCKSIFTCTYRGGKRPMLLSCSHSMCEKCLQLIWYSGFAKCSVCGLSTNFDKDKHFREQFEINYNMLGLLNYIEFSAAPETKGNVSAKTEDPILELPKLNKNEKLCYECTTEYTSYHCTQCNAPYCKNCFRNIHSIGKALQSHSLTLIADPKNNVQNPFQRSFCQFHANNEVNYFCPDCNMVMCNICETTHQHSVHPIAHQNRKELPQLKEIIETVKMAKNYGKQAEKDVSLNKSKFDDYATDVVQNIANQFIHMHSILQNLERRLLQRVKCEIIDLIDKNQLIATTLNDSQNKLQTIIDCLNGYYVEVPETKLISSIIEETKSLLDDTPTCVQFESTKERPIQFHVLQPFNIDELERNFKIKFPDELFKPKISSCFGDDIKLAEASLRPGNISKVMKLNKSKSQSQQQRGTSSGLKYQGRNPNQPITSMVFENKVIQQHSIPLTVNNLTKHNAAFPTIHPSLLKNDARTNSSYDYNRSKIITQMVHVSHIKTPNYFYVQSDKFTNLFESFQDELKEAGDYASPVPKVDIGEIYLIKDGRYDDVCRRGKVLSKNNENNEYLVLFIDYGNKEHVQKDRFREISVDLKTKPAGAQLCSLYNIGPAKGDWTDGAAQLMNEIISHDFLYMLVLHEIDDIFIVDLITNNVSNKTSIRDALIFTNYGISKIDCDQVTDSYLKIFQDVKNKIIETDVKKLFKNSFREGDFFKVNILHAVSPHEFYIVKTDHKELLTKYQKELNQTYQDSNDNKIYQPRVNMICAVKYLTNWFRGKVVKVLPDGMCSIFLIDVGLTTKVPYQNLRVINEKFLTMNEGISCCKLSDIEPISNDQYSDDWSEDAIDEFKRLARSSNFEICVDKNREYFHEVTLYMNKRQCDVCINSYLIRLKFAVSVSGKPLQVEYYKNELKDLQRPGGIANNNNATVKQPTTTRVKATIVHIVSPNEFYVNLEKNIPIIEQMHSNIQEKMANYSVSDRTPIEWHNGDGCLVYTLLKHKGIKCWYRGKIMSINEDGPSFDVYLRDVGCTVNIKNQHEIATIEANFHYLQSGAMRCSLACVQATGGSSQWSLTAIDEFSNVINEFEAIGLSLQGKKNDQSKSVIVWGRTSECTDPLEPTSYHWVNINKILVTQGFAHLIENFLPIPSVNTIDCDVIEGFHSFESWIKDLDKTIAGGPTQETYECLDGDATYDPNDISNEVTPIAHWLPALPLQKTHFLGIPTYVDNNAVIYMRDASQTNLLARMNTLINDKYKNCSSSIDATWTDGEPCIAKYHLDKEYYRGIVLKVIDKNKIKVQFIDYGNIEDCTPNDLHKEVILGRIPVQIKKYSLANIIPVPNESAVKWSLNVLDFLHASIVGKLCVVQVIDKLKKSKDDEIHLCRLTENSIDIARMLVNREMAVLSSKTSLIEEQDILFDPYDNNVNIDIVGNTYDFKKEFKCNKENMRKMVLERYVGEQSKNVKNLCDAKSTTSTDSPDIIVEESSPCVSLRHSSCSNPMVKQNTNKVLSTHEDYKEYFANKALEDIVDNFDKISVSKYNADDEEDIEYRYGEFVKPRYHSGIGDERPVSDIISCPSEIDDEHFMANRSLRRTGKPLDFIQIPLQSGISGFYAEIIFICDYLNMFVSPEIPKFKETFSKMMDDIQLVARQLKRIKNITVGMPCLAIFSEDNLWYRAKVQKYDENNDIVTVLFVDYLNTEKVQSKQIRPLPTSLFKIPLKPIKVTLHGIKPDIHSRRDDIERKLSIVLTNKSRFFVRIVKMQDIPLVEFYCDRNMDTLVYQSLIDQGYYKLVYNVFHPDSTVLISD